MNVTPASTAAFIAARDCPSSVSPQLPPIAQAPKPISDTSCPVFPSRRSCTTRDATRRSASREEQPAESGEVAGARLVHAEGGSQRPAPVRELRAERGVAPAADACARDRALAPVGQTPLELHRAADE